MKYPEFKRKKSSLLNLQNTSVEKLGDNPVSNASKLATGKLTFNFNRHLTSYD